MITILNLVAGCIAIVAAMENRLEFAAYTIGVAAVLDFLDGFLARALKASSEIGKQLDSLADMVSFGVAPAIILFKIMSVSLVIHEFESGAELDIWLRRGLLMFPFLIAVCSAIRLARFNSDPEQEKEFKGLPTPANAILIASIPLILINHPPIAEYTLNIYIVEVLVLFQSMLLISNIRMFGLKTNSFSFKGNQVRYIFLAVTIALIIVFQYISIPIIIWLYVLISILKIENLFVKKY